MDGIFFDRQDYRLVHMINAFLDRDITRDQKERHMQTLKFHPNGLREFGFPKAFRVASAVIGLLDTTATSTPDERLDALRVLQAETYSSASSALRLNTARVLVQLMKELLRARGDTAEQLKLAHDFNKVASGRPRIVRTLLHRHNLLEMPEEWNQRSFDYHVHDSNTSGRKSPTHLIMDAWLKGIRMLKVIYENYAPADAAKELLAAAGIMDVKVRIGIRFRRYFRNRMITLVWTPRGFSGPQGFIEFLDQPGMQALTAEGQSIASRDHARFMQLIDLYNREYRVEINNRFGLPVPELEMSEFYAAIGKGHPSWAHLADCIHRRTVAAMGERWREISAQLLAEQDENARAAISGQLDAMEQFSPAMVMDEWLQAAFGAVVLTSRIADEAVADKDPPSLLKRLAGVATDYRLSVDIDGNTPPQLLQLLYRCEGRITHLELFRLRNYREGQLPLLMAMNELRETVNSSNPYRFKHLVQSYIAETPPDHEDDLRGLEEALQAMPRLLAHYASHPLSCFVSSGSSGRSEWGGQHGMGFVIVETLTAKEQRYTRTQSGREPLPLRFSLIESIERKIDPAIERSARFSRDGILSWLIYIWFRIVTLFSGGKRKWIAPLESLRLMPQGNVLALGGTGVFAGNRFAVNGKREKEHLLSRRGYVNTVLINSAFILAGFVTAMLTFQYTQKGSFLAFWGAPLWFFITGIRNILQAVIAGGGLRRYSILTWKDYVSWTRISESLFYTGLSVPLLELGVRYLLLEKGLGLTASNNSGLVFLIMALVNGVYIMAHNLYRGLPTAAAYANMGRSLAAVPIAMIYNFCLILILQYFKVGDIPLIIAATSTLVSKTASDTSAALIEGYIDRQVTLRLRMRDFQTVLARLFNCQAELELLFPEADSLELLRRPDQLVHSPEPKAKQLAEAMAVHCLDLLYFHFYQPLAAQTLQKIAKKMQPEEKTLLLRCQNLLELDSFVTQLFLDGLFGTQFRSALAFYLYQHRKYRKVLPKLLNVTESGSDVYDPAAGDLLL